MRKYITTGVALLVVAFGLACAETADPETADSPSPLPSPEAAAAAAATPTPTPTPTPEPTATPTPLALSPQELIDSAAAAMRGLTSFHFDMDMQIKVASEGLTLDVPLAFVGDFQAPDRLRATMSLSVAFFTIETEVVGIGDTTYTRDPETGEWDVSVGEDAFIISPDEFMGEGVSDLTDLAFVGVETLDGVGMYRLQGTSATGAFTDSASDFVLSFWIRIDDGYLAQINAEGELDLGEENPLLGDVAGGTATAALSVKFSAYGEPVSIEPPDLDAPPPTPTPAPTGEVTDVDKLRQLALDYWAAFNAYDEEKVLSYLEEAYRAERESDIRKDIGRLKSFGVKLNVSEDSAPRVISPGLGDMTLKLQEPLGTRTVMMAFIEVDGEWKIAFAEEIE